MREIALEQLKKRIGNELNDLPFKITKRGKIIAIVLKDKNHMVGAKHTVDNHMVMVKHTVKEDINHTVETNHTVDSKVAASNIDTPQDVKKWHNNKFGDKHITYFKSAHSK